MLKHNSSKAPGTIPRPAAAARRGGFREAARVAGVRETPRAAPPHGLCLEAERPAHTASLLWQPGK